jgi:4-hydroxy-3-polyprenylbenzoate decarboxylase
MKKIIVGITGASGSILAHRFIEALLFLNNEVHLVITPNGEKVCEYELEQSFEEMLEFYKKLGGKIYYYQNDDLFARISSGSYKTDAMVIIPCSMGTLGKVANGISDTLLTRTADVMIKEDRRLILITRESPLSSIHLENMLKLSRIGVTIMPPVPSFYNKPKNLEESISLTVGRILQNIDIENPYHKVWGESNE